MCAPTDNLPGAAPNHVVPQDELGRNGTMAQPGHAVKSLRIVRWRRTELSRDRRSAGVRLFFAGDTTR
jgi:hypothetical protein